MEYILYRYSKLFSVYLKKKHEENIDNPSIRIYINKIKNRITLKILTGYYLVLLLPEIMKLLGSIENTLTKDENGKNVPHTKVRKVVLVYCK